MVTLKKNKSGGKTKLLGNGGLVTHSDGHQEFDIDDSGETLFDGPDSKFLFDALQPTNDVSTHTQGLNHRDSSHLAVSTYSHPPNPNATGLGVQNMRLGNSLDPATMLEELVHQQAMQDSFEHRLRELEHQSARVTGENALLKRVVAEIGGRQAETQQRVDGLLKFIYSVFITNADSLPTSIAQSAVCWLHYYRLLLYTVISIIDYLFLFFPLFHFMCRKHCLMTPKDFSNTQASRCQY